MLGNPFWMALLQIETNVKLDYPLAKGSADELSVVVIFRVKSFFGPSVGTANMASAIVNFRKCSLNEE